MTQPPMTQPDRDRRAGPADWAVRRFLKAVVAQTGRRISLSAPAEVRAAVEAVAVVNGPGPAMARVRDEYLPAGGRELRVRVLEPLARPFGQLVYLHGGGWVAGSAETADTVARKLAERTACAVIVPDYRLAPEHPYPAAVQDCRAALEWAAGRAGDGPLIVLGEGAGGNLAAAIAGRPGGDGGPGGRRPVDLQILLYPPLDLRPAGPGGAAGAPDDAGWETGVLSDCARWYLGDQGSPADPGASPGLAADLSGLPRTTIIGAGNRQLAAQAARYRARLEAAGVDVSLHALDGQPAGFFSVLMLPGSELAFQRVVRDVRAALARRRPA